MRDGGAGRRRCGTLTAVFLLSLSVVPLAVARDWDTMRESQRDKLKADEGRVAEIEAREQAGPVDREKRADRITRDRIARIRASLKSGGESKRLPDAVERASSEAKALLDVYESQDELLASVTRAWGPDGAERRKLRESIARLQKNLEDAKLNLAMATEALGATAARVPESGMLEKIAGIEAALGEVDERRRVRWQREHAMRERERELRERGAAERARGVR
jgi:hypothetical protein